MTAPDAIHALVAKFDQHQKEYQTHKNETELRREFLDPFFEALGWDVFNKKSYSERFKEVLHEASVEVEGKAKAADYAFRVGDKTMFFVEAKKPSVKIGENPEPAFQLRRYGWSAKLPVSILTDFEQLAVYECKTKPKKTDKASFGRVKLYHYSEYIQKWDEIAGIFSREAVLQGAFDQFAEGTKGKKGTAQVDDAFLEEIERWRELLARNIALRNPSIRNERELNYAVQLTIDRIVFLRICEDRGIEPEGQLQDIGNGKQIYTELVALFRRADTQYNSGLFHFADEKGQSSSPDTLTPDLQIDDKVLKDILRNLYYPESPYVFTYLSTDILGQVYERFLGKVIRLTAGHQAKVEEKPEVRKAGGVYYTPTYIVEYIVENTVGKLVEGKTPKQVAKLKILDPACGSGSFLLGAYQFLLNWHDDWYTNNEPEKWASGKDPAIYQAMDGDWRLTTSEKKRILLNNIYGVDIDAQAVEVTKLSLLLKVLEEESGQLTLGFERVLPDLGENIKCGNSLIGPDYYDERQMPLLPDEEFYRVNAFDWEKEFSGIFAKGGFDAVIGNPPYLRIQGLQENYGEQINYFLDKYESAVKRFDLYLLFTEKGFELLRKSGQLGFICPHKFVNSDFGSGLRRLLISNTALRKIISFGNNLIFSQASTYTGLIFLKKAPHKTFKYYEFDNMHIEEIPAALERLSNESFTVYEIENFSDSEWVLTKKDVAIILNSISKQPNPLGQVTDNILVGVQSGIDNIHVMKFVKNLPDGNIRLFSERANQNVEIESGLVKPFLRGEDVHRYKEPNFQYYCVYPYKLLNGKTKILEERELRERYPKGFNYLKEYQRELTEIRKRQRTNPKYWYSCHRSRDMNIFESVRIVTPEISLGCNMTIASAGLYHNTKVYSIVPSKSRDEHQNYWLGLLNSKIMWWFISNTGYVLRGGYFVFKTNYLKPFPIHTINFSNPAEKAQHDKVVALVDSMLELHKRQASASTPRDAVPADRGDG